MSGAFKLHTTEGEVLPFDTAADMMDYVISRMIENGEIAPVGRDKDDDLIVGLSA